MRLVVATVVMGAFLAPRAGGAEEPPIVWVPPVDGAVEREFRAGWGAYQRGGHAGLDYGVSPGEEVRAAGRGRVTFTGRVAGATFVVVGHGDDLRTTYAPMATVDVRRGDVVERGQRLGTAAAAGLRHHDDGVVHFGLRRGDEALDPAQLFAPLDLTRLVRLVPADDLDEMALPSRQSELVRLVRWFGGGASTAASTITALARRIPSAAPLPQRLVIGGAQGAHDWWRRRRSCTPMAAAREIVVDTGHHVVPVGGLNSSWRPGRTAPYGLPLAELGYRPHEVVPFSYTQPGERYHGSDTHIGPGEAAARLAAQLRAWNRRNPGRTVDLIGHSQGGVAIEAFLKLHYVGNEDEYPAIGKVVTLAAPHRGVPLAGLAGRLASFPLVGLASRAGHALLADLPAPGSGSARELAEGSALLTALAGAPLPEGLAMTTIGAVDDPLVPAHRTRVDGADHVIVDPTGFFDHTPILTDEQGVSAVRLALAGAAPACIGFLDSVRGRALPLLFDPLP